MNPAKLFAHNIIQIDGAIRSACIRHNIPKDQAEDFASDVKLKLVEDDYRRLRAFRGRSSFTTYLYTLITRIFIDRLRQEKGRWRPSTKAIRLGDEAVEMERLIYRDNYSFDEAYQILTTNHGYALSREEARSTYAALPLKKQRQLKIANGYLLDNIPAENQSVINKLDAARLISVQEKLKEYLVDLRQALSFEDRLLLKMRFEDGLSISAIARALHLQRGQVEGRLKTIMRKFKEEILARGMNINDVIEVIRGEGTSGDAHV